MVDVCLRLFGRTNKVHGFILEISLVGRKQRFVAVYSFQVTENFGKGEPISVVLEEKDEGAATEEGGVPFAFVSLRDVAGHVGDVDERNHEALLAALLLAVHEDTVAVAVDRQEHLLPPLEETEKASLRL